MLFYSFPPHTFSFGKSNLNLEKTMKAFTPNDFDINNVKTVQKLLLENKINVNTRLNGSPMVSICKNPDVIKLLIKHNVNINVLDENGNPPLLCHIENMKIFRILVEAKADISFRCKDGRSLLHELSNKIASSDEELCDEITMMETLISLGIPVDIQDQFGRTPLFGTIHPEKAWVLIRNGADINHHSKEKCANSPLLYCVKNAHIPSYREFFRLIQFLLDNGADYEHCDLQGYCFAHLYWEKTTWDSYEFFKLLSDKSLSNEILKLLMPRHWIPSNSCYPIYKSCADRLKEYNLSSKEGFISEFSYFLSKFKSIDKIPSWADSETLYLSLPLFIIFGLPSLLLSLGFILTWIMYGVTDPAGLCFIMFTIFSCFYLLFYMYCNAKRDMMLIQLRDIILKHNGPNAATSYTLRKLSWRKKLVLTFIFGDINNKDFIHF